MTVFSRWTWIILALTAIALTGCGEKPSSSIRDITTRTVTFPDGTKIRAEMAIDEVDLRRGLQYRDSLAEDAGMLFVYGKPGFYRYWMHEVKFPIDILWLDQNHRIVQLIHKVPPCAGPAETCPVYGGDFSSIFVLELNSGTALKHNLKPGMTLEF